ncbi:MAG: hypothetical protein HY721_16675, partial [Planctomycetes bacterium]|nr:hypothetical protein [Planctomycetota bacterium]
MAGPAYRFQPLKHAECRTEEGPKMFFLDEFGKTYTTAYYFWLLEGGGR